MGQETDRQRAPRDRIARLRARLQDVRPPNTAPQLIAVLHGMLDLLADELERRP